jgi:Neuraminidase (sialidase)
MYVSWNDFARGANIFVRYSTDNGNTWTDERQVTNGGPFIRNVQITGDQVTGDVYMAGMDENGGNGCTSGCGTNRSNKIYRSTDGGNTWTNTYTAPTSSALAVDLWATSAPCTAAPLTGGTWAGVSQSPSTAWFTRFMPRATPATTTPATSSTSAPPIAG